MQLLHEPHMCATDAVHSDQQQHEPQHINTPSHTKGPCLPHSLHKVAAGTCTRTQPTTGTQQHSLSFQQGAEPYIPSQHWQEQQQQQQQHNRQVPRAQNRINNLAALNIKHNGQQQPQAWLEGSEADIELCDDDAWLPTIASAAVPASHASSRTAAVAAALGSTSTLRNSKQRMSAMNDHITPATMQQQQWQQQQRLSGTLRDCSVHDAASTAALPEWQDRVGQAPHCGNICDDIQQNGAVLSNARQQSQRQERQPMLQQHTGVQWQQQQTFNSPRARMHQQMSQHQQVEKDVQLAAVSHQQHPSQLRLQPAATNRWAHTNMAAQPVKVSKPAITGASGGGPVASTAAAACSALEHRAKGRAERQQRGNDTAGKVAKSSTVIERTFVKATGGSNAPGHQPKMHQLKIEAMLQKRAHQHNLQEQEQQQDSLGTGSGSSDSASICPNPAAATVSGNSFEHQRSRSGASAAVASSGSAQHRQPAAPIKRKGSADVPGDLLATGEGTATAGIHGSSGGNRKRRKSSKTAAQLAADQALTAATEELDLHILSSSSSSADNKSGCSTIVHGAAAIDLSSTGALSQLQQEIATADAVAVGLLLCRTAGQAVQYYTSLQQLTKEQQLLLRKQARLCRRAVGAGVDGDNGNDKAAAAGADADEAAAAVTDSNELEVVGLAMMPAATPAAAAANTLSNSSNSRCMYYLHIPSGSTAQQMQQQQSPVLLLVSELLHARCKRPVVCSNAKLVLCCLSGLGMQLPAAQGVTLLDAEVLAWLADPQLVQDTKQDSSKPADCYSLRATVQRYGLQSAAGLALAPLQRLHQQLQASISLADFLLRKLRGQVGDKAITLEMQVAVIVAKMELAGVGIDPQHLLGHKAALQQRMAAINARAAELAGGPFNLASSSQLAKVLYQDLRLPAPAGTSSRGSARTHLPTDESSLKQLQLTCGHELPGLVIEYRSKQNAMSKYFDAPWVQRAAKQAAAAANMASSSSGHKPHPVALHCCWNQTNTATGRLSSCSPNLQAVTKYSITAEQQSADCVNPSEAAAASLTFRIRDVFVARPGTILLSADYSQIELRLLAAFSGDQLLQQLLNQSGAQGDVFSLIAAAWQHPGRVVGAAAGVQVDAATRERAKRVTYGIIYGSGAYGLSQQLQEQGVSIEQAHKLIDSFLSRFSGVQQYMAVCLAQAKEVGAVQTLLQRVRPIADLNASNAKDRQAAERKVVNTIIQGSAADLVKLAMAAWDAWAESEAAKMNTASAAAAQSSTGIRPSMGISGRNATNTTKLVEPGGLAPACARLIGQIHDELLFEVDATDTVFGAHGEVLQPGPTLLHVASVVKSVMEGAAELPVALRVQLSYGSRWGSMHPLEACSAKQ